MKKLLLTFLISICTSSLFAFNGTSPYINPADITSEATSRASADLAIGVSTGSLQTQITATSLSTGTVLGSIPTTSTITFVVPTISTDTSEMTGAYQASFIATSSFTINQISMNFPLTLGTTNQVDGSILLDVAVNGTDVRTNIVTLPTGVQKSSNAVCNIPIARDSELSFQIAANSATYKITDLNINCRAWKTIGQ